MKTRFFLWCLFAVMLLCLWGPWSPVGAAATFQPLGDLEDGGFRSRAYGISPNASFVAGLGRGYHPGSPSYGQTRAVRWDMPSIVLHDLGILTGEEYYYQSYAIAVSNDGAVVVGQSFYQDPDPEVDYTHVAFLWEDPGPMVPLGYLEGHNRSEARDVSADGAVVVGFSDHSNPAGPRGEAFRWTEADGLQGLGHLGEGDQGSNANAITPDGAIIVGGSASSDGYQAVRWLKSDTSYGPPTGLGGLTGPPYSCSATDVSSDGSVIVGNDHDQAVRWTAGSGWQDLGDLPGGLGYIQANAVSGDGSRVVGLSELSDGYEAFIWDPVNGMQSLKQVLLDNGVGPELADWQLRSARDISQDGSTIVGYGINPDDKTEAWLATLEIVLKMDVKPFDCPNYLDLRSKGKIPVAVLGREGVDVHSIDVSTLRLTREGVAESVSPLMWSYKDEAGPDGSAPCDCQSPVSDGHMDLILHFSAQEVIQALSLNGEGGNQVTLKLTGTNLDGLPVTAEDCVNILGKPWL